MPGRNRRFDSYISRCAPFAQPILTHIRELWHEADPGISEEIKWGAPHFTHKGIAGAMAGFKHHVSMGFWNRRLLTDPEGLFCATDGTHLSAIKVSELDELPSDNILLAYMREAVALNQAGVKRAVTKPSEQRELVIPDILTTALRNSPAATKVFQAFSWSNQKDYAQWIDGAKQKATRKRRLDQAIEWMEEGKPRNWKYMAKYRESEKVKK